MISADDKKYLRFVWTNTSETVREWMSERIKACEMSNPWAEEQLKVFIKLHKKHGSGITAHKMMYGEYQQLPLE